MWSHLLPTPLTVNEARTTYLLPSIYSILCVHVRNLYHKDFSSHTPHTPHAVFSIHKQTKPKNSSDFVSSSTLVLPNTLP